jgi:hypothetical protein
MLVEALLVRGKLNAEGRLYDGVVVDKFIADEDGGVERVGDGGASRERLVISIKTTNCDRLQD